MKQTEFLESENFPHAARIHIFKTDTWPLCRSLYHYINANKNYQFI